MDLLRVSFVFCFCLFETVEDGILSLDARMSDKSPNTFQTKFDTKNFWMFHE